MHESLVKWCKLFGSEKYFTKVLEHSNHCLAGRCSHEYTKIGFCPKYLFPTIKSTRFRIQLTTNFQIQYTDRINIMNMYEVNLTPYRIKSVYKSLDQTVHTFRYPNLLSAIMEDFFSIRFQPHQVVQSVYVNQDVQYNFWIIIT